MQDWTRWYATDFLADDHVSNLRKIATETHTNRRRAAAHDGLVLRMRAALGRRIVSFGSAVAGTRVAGTHA